MKLGFIGAGEMGGAIIRGLLKQGIATENILAAVHTKDSAKRLQDSLGIFACTDNLRVIREADYLFLAIKPAQLREVLHNIAQSGIAPKVIVSMVLGGTLQKIQQVLQKWPIIRIMPNTPLLLGEGITLFQFSPEVSSKDRQEVRSLFDKMGQTFEISDSLFDAATALSGSGPAFVYAFIEALASAASAQGIETKTATRLAVQTVIGAAKMVLAEQKTPQELIQKVSTPNGCTAAGMNVLQPSNFKQIISDTLAATACRAREVGK